MQGKFPRVEEMLVVTFPTEYGDFVVYNDASKKGLGSVLMQNDEVITYTSRQLKDYE
jgi:hypothetical protein